MFPAYNEGESWRRPDSRSFPRHSGRQEGRPSCSFTSFTSTRRVRDVEEEERKRKELEELERKKREKKRHQKEEDHRRAMSRFSIKSVGINDSDDDSDTPGMEPHTISSRVEESRRRIKEEKRSSSESSGSDDDLNQPSISQLLAPQETWSFLKSDWRPHIPGSFFVTSLKAEKGNIYFDNLPAREVPEYYLAVHRILGGCDELDRKIFPVKQSKKKEKRYFDDKVVRKWNSNPKRYNTPMSARSVSGYIELADVRHDSRTAVTDSEPLVPAIEFISETESTPEMRSKLYNKRLRDEPENIDLWMRFLAVQDEIYLARDDVKDSKRKKNEVLTDRALLDRKLNILDKALQKNTQSVKLKLERLKVGRHLWESETFEKEIKSVKFFHVNDPEMWNGVFDLLESDVRRFTYEKMIQLLREGISQLVKVSRGEICTHLPLSSTEPFIVTVMIRMIRLMFDCGYSEKAIGCAQAFCEFNICCPDEFKTHTLRERVDEFTNFWKSGIARVGDVDGKGWGEQVQALKTRQFTTDRDQVNAQDGAREKIEFDYATSLGPNGQKRSLSEQWSFVETLRHNQVWLPVRDSKIQIDDRDRYVDLKDIQVMLVPMKVELCVKFLFDVLNLFGATIYGRDDISPEKISFTFGYFPTHLFTRFDGFDAFVARFLDTVKDYLPDYRSQLVCSLLVTKWDFIYNYSRLPEGKKSKTARAEARELIRKNADNKSLWATFAEKLLEIGEKEQTRKIALSVLGGKNIWEDSSDRIPILRLTIYYILSCNGADWSRVTSLIFKDGKVGNDDAREVSGSTVEKFYNKYLRAALDRRLISWEGSELDLVGTLVLLYNARSKTGLTHWNRLTTVHDGVTSISPNLELPVFTKHHVALVKEHLASNKHLAPKALHKELGKLVVQYPHDVGFLKEVVSAKCVGKALNNLRKFLDQPTQDPTTELYRAIASVHLELSRYRMQTIAFEAQCHSVEKLCSVMESASSRLNQRYDLFWRLLLFVRNERKELERCREVFHLAQNVCPWSKPLILDFAKIEPDAYITLLTLMEEKCLRIHCQKDEVPLLGVVS